MNRISAALCAGLRQPRLPEHEALLRSLTGDEWSAVAALAARQRVSALFHSLNSAGVPEAVVKILRYEARAAAMRGLQFQAEFKRLADEVSPIQLLALKGVYLASAVYPHIGLREMSDMDLMVRYDDAEAVAAAARRQGFVAVKEIDTEAAIHGLHHHHLAPMMKGNLRLEIHLRLAPPGSPPLAAPADLFRRAQTLAVAGNVLALCPEDALVHVCCHATMTHQLELGIRSLCDVRAMIAAYGDSLSWDAVRMRATEWQCERGTALTLTLARDFLGAEVPDAVLARFGTALPTPAVIDVAKTHILADTTIRHKITKTAGKILAARTTRGRLRYLWSRIAMDDDFLAMSFPDIGGPRSWRRAAVLASRTAILIRRYGWDIGRLVLKPASTDRTAINDRNTLEAWLARTD